MHKVGLGEGDDDDVVASAHTFILFRAQIEQLQAQLNAALGGASASSGSAKQDAAINTSFAVFSREASLVKPLVVITENSPAGSPVKGTAGFFGGGSGASSAREDGSEPSISALHRSSFRLDANHSSFQSDAHVDIPR